MQTYEPDNDTLFEPQPIVLPRGDFTFNRAGRLVPVDSPDAVRYVVPPGMRVSFDGLTRQHVDGNYVREFIASESDPEDEMLEDDEDELDSTIDTLDGEEDGDSDLDTDESEEEDDEDDELCEHGFGLDEDCPDCDGEDGDLDDDLADLDSDEDFEDDE